MVVFLLTLMPLSYWAVQYLFDQDNVRMTDRILPFFYGLVVAVPVILFQWGLDVYFPLNWSPMGIYSYTFFNKEGIILYPVLLFLFLIFRKKSYTGIPLRELTAWLCGYYFMFSISEALVLKAAVTPYTAVLLPLIRLFTVLLAAVLLCRSFLSEGNVKKTVFTVLLFVLPLFLNALPVMNIVNRMVLFYITLIILGGASKVLYYLESRGALG
ncbi:MAG: hypothetical protein PQJ58_15000 [Spirochaetales bacterium]|nr:hypothetical protein [Spirochaetales bacterium]